MVVLDDYIVDCTIMGHGGTVDANNRHYENCRTLPIRMVSLAQSVKYYAELADFGDVASISIIDTITGELIAGYEYSYDGNGDYACEFLVQDKRDWSLRDMSYRVKRFLGGTVGWSIGGTHDVDKVHSYCELIDLIAFNMTAPRIEYVTYEFLDNYGKHQQVFVN